MFKVIFILYMFSNIYDNIINKDNPTTNIIEFIEKQQYREDQLRQQCNLGNFMIKPKQNFHEKLYDDIKFYLSDKITENVYPILYNTPIQCKSFNEFILNSQDINNINRELIYDNKKFTLKNNNPPIWILNLDKLNIEISDIKEYY